LKEIEKEIDLEMARIVADCVDCVTSYGIGLHDRMVRCGKLYSGRTLRILEKIYGVTEMTFSTEPQQHKWGFPWRTLVFGPKVDK
jgi:hypothetical protein